MEGHGDGWFNTGDVGSLDASGYLFIRHFGYLIEYLREVMLCFRLSSGRSKEIINRGGETISPFEVEEALQQHPAVKEALAFSAPHRQFQETVGVMIVTKAGQQR